MFNEVYIDYFGGTHGNFLEFVLNKWVFDVASADFNPFNKLGASHNKTQLYTFDKKAHCGHYSFGSIKNKIPGSNKAIIRIIPDLFYVALYNSFHRAGDVSLDMVELEYDTLSKLNNEKFSDLRNTIVSQIGTSTNNSRSELRNIFYSALSESELGEDKMTEWKVFSDHIYTFQMSSLYNFNDFVKQLGCITTFLGKIGWSYNDELFELWQEFMAKNTGLASHKKVNKIIQDILTDKQTQIELNILEEAYINSFITKTFNIYSDIPCFSDVYPTDTKTIYNSIVNQVTIQRGTQWI